MILTVLHLDHAEVTQIDGNDDNTREGQAESSKNQQLVDDKYVSDSIDTVETILNASNDTTNMEVPNENKTC